MSRIPLLLAGVLSCGAASITRADVVIDLSAPVFIGATHGYVDLDITGDSISTFDLTFQLMPDASNSPAYMLQFSSMLKDPANPLLGGLYTGTDTLSNPRYVFGPHSIASATLDSGSGFGNTVSDAAGNQTILNVGDKAIDSSFDPLDVPLTGANNLLARLQFAFPASAPAAKFDLALTSASFSSSTNPSIPIGSTSIVSETLSVASPTNVVPEPGMFGMLLAGTTGLLWMKRKRASVDPRPSNS